MTDIYREQLPNGLTLLAEPVASAQSLSMTALIPAGLSAQRDDQLGSAPMLAEMVCRGAAGLSSREHSDALDQLGVDRSTSVDTHHLRLSATMIGAKREKALPLLLDMLRRPNLDEDALEPSRALCLQSIDALADEPQQRVMIELRRCHYPEPFNRSPLGQRDHLERITLEDVRGFWRTACVPGDTILAFAGRFDWDALRDQVRDLLGDWQGDWTEPATRSDALRGYSPITADTSQVHIGLAYDALPEADERSFLQRAGAAVLSGGMSGRLFTEVREKRGLCYAVYAAYSAQKDRGVMMGYAGTTTPRAQETLDVMRHELARLSEGVTRSEFDRAIVGMKSRLVMQGESTGARAAAIARDQHILGHPRTLDELAAKVDAITLDKLNAFLAEHPPGDMTLVTIGPHALNLEAQSAAHP
ncbi:MAG: M16 family metallopeptidase [Phycisphaeraceae bacterium]